MVRMAVMELSRNCTPPGYSEARPRLQGELRGLGRRKSARGLLRPGLRRATLVRDMARDPRRPD